LALPSRLVLAIFGPAQRKGPRNVPEAPYCRWRTSGQTTAIPILALTSWKNCDLRGLNEGVGWVPSRTPGGLSRRIVYPLSDCQTCHRHCCRSHPQVGLQQTPQRDIPPARPARSSRAARHGEDAGNGHAAGPRRSEPESYWVGRCVTRAEVHAGVGGPRIGVRIAASTCRAGNPGFASDDAIYLECIALDPIAAEPAILAHLLHNRSRHHAVGLTGAAR
jgi:hypothetical protein